MSKTTNDGFLTIRVKTDTYYKLARLINKKKKKNLEEIGRVGNANFDGIINNLLNNSYQPDKQQVNKEKKQ